MASVVALDREEGREGVCSLNVSTCTCCAEVRTHLRRVPRSHSCRRLRASLTPTMSADFRSIAQKRVCMEGTCERPKRAANYVFSMTCRRKKDWRMLRLGAIQVLAGRRAPSMQERRPKWGSQTTSSREASTFNTAILLHRDSPSYVFVLRIMAI
jgi:hypothetical protein